MSAIRFASLLFAFCFAGMVSAATFTANNFSDLNDNNPGDGVCNVGDGSCSFRAAVQESNALAGPDTIMLAAGTYNLTQTYVCGGCGGTVYGQFVDIRSDVEIIGEGVGASFLQGSDVNYSGAVIQVNVTDIDGGPIRFSDLSMDPGTFAGFQGSYFNQMIGLTNYNCATCPLELERVELNVEQNSNAGGSSPLGFSGFGPAVVRDSALNYSGGNTTSPAGISAVGGVPLLIEDFTMNGGNSAVSGVSYTAFGSGPNSLTIRRSRFTGLGSTGEAAIAMTNINIPVQMQLLIEDSEVVGGARGVKIRNWGTQSQTTHATIERSLFTGTSAEAFLLAGPCSVTLRNSTISSAPTGVALTAPENGGTGTCAVSLDSVTIAGGGTSVAVGSGLGTISARNSILANATSAACTGTMDSLGHNLIEGTCKLAGDITGNITGVDPMLDVLADNGGPTRTRALMPGSPAVDAGDATNCPLQDQRSFARPADGDGDLSAVCDMGAFEKDAVAPPSNEPPDAQDDSAEVAEDGSVSIDVAANDSDPDGNLDPNTTNTLCSECSEPSQGALQNNGDGSFEYSPDADYHGADSFSYEICDTAGLCDSATVTITVTPVNDAPLAADDAASLDEDDGLIMGAPSLLINDDDPDGDTLTISEANGATGQGGSFACDASGCSYNPIADFFGIDNFDYEVCDDGSPALCDTATVVVTVNPVNDAPSFLPGPAQVFAGGASGAQSAPAWASMIDLGPGESSQSVLAFEVMSVTDPDGVVQGLPAIDSTGDLTLTLSGSSGTAGFSVVLRDDGGVADGGVDASAPMSLNIAVGTSADLAVSIEQCSKQAPPGEVYDYAMRIDNNGPHSALDVVLVAPLPAGASVDALGNANCMDAGSSVACHIGQLAAGDSIAVPVGLLMPAGGAATLDLAATISSTTDDANGTNDNASATVDLVPGLILDTSFESCDGLAD